MQIKFQITQIAYDFLCYSKLLVKHATDFQNIIQTHFWQRFKHLRINYLK